MSTPPLQSVPRCFRHPATETRLSCSSCGTPICPQCMVMTEVGFKCPGCIGRIKSHSLEVGKGRLMLGGGLGLLAGVLFGELLPFLFGLGFFVIFGIPLVALLMAYLAGRGAGALIHRAVQYKMGLPLRMAVLMGGVAGLMVGAYGGMLWSWMASAIQASAATSLSATSGIVLIRTMVGAMAGLLFLRGLIEPFRTR